MLPCLVSYYPQYSLYSYTVFVLNPDIFSFIFNRFYMKQSLYTHASLPNRLVEPVIGQEVCMKPIP